MARYVIDVIMVVRIIRIGHHHGDNHDTVNLMLPSLAMARNRRVPHATVAYVLLDMG